MASTWEGVVRALRKEGRVVEAEGGPKENPSLEAGGLAERAGFEPARQV